MRRLGKKGLEWQRERRKRLKELEATGNYKVEGTLLYGHCKDCGRWGLLDLDHIDGRGGFEPHRMENLDPICRRCHDIRHGKIMSEEKKKSKGRKKAEWEMDHKCQHCKQIVSTLLCSNCGKLSVKT